MSDAFVVVLPERVILATNSHRDPDEAQAPATRATLAASSEACSAGFSPRASMPATPSDIWRSAA